MGNLARDGAIARAAFRRYASYRAATVAGIITNSFFGILLSSVLLTVTRQRRQISGYTETDLLTQVWITQGLLMTVALWGWVEIGERVRSGDIAVDLYRPVDLQRYWLAHDTGRAAYQMLIRGTAPFVVALFLFRLHLPAHWWMPPLFLASVMLANVVCFALRFLVNICAFWLHDVRGPTRIAMAVWTALSGSSVSLALFPDGFERVIRWGPFAQIIQVPVDVWLERKSLAGTIGQLGLQCGWAAVLLGFGRLLLRRASRVAVVQGG